MTRKLAGCLALSLAVVVAAPVARAQTADAPIRISPDAKVSPAQRERLQSYANQGGEALRRFLWRTRMIYNWRINDLVDPRG
jgi:hypothetical protein